MKPGLLIFFTIAVVLSAGESHARTVRRLFEPTDLQLQEGGLVEFDMQMGLIRGPDAFRASIPDFELNFGLAPWIEFDIDGAFALRGEGGDSFRFDRWDRDNLWLSVKLGLLDLNLDASKPGNDLAIGVQVGPKVPFAPGARGLGVEALALIGLAVGKSHYALNAGALFDPAGEGGVGRPRGLEGGLDLSRDLDDRGAWALTGEIGGVRFLSSDANQLSVTLGAQWSPNDRLTFSLVGLAGVLDGSDRYGVLLGVSPTARLWRPAHR